jgi:hypothetical protein
LTASRVWKRFDTLPDVFRETALRIDSILVHGLTKNL